MFSPLVNSYLQSGNSESKAAVINRYVEQANNVLAFKKSSSFKRLNSAQPSIPKQSISTLTTPYGARAIPVLQERLQSRDYHVVSNAIDSLSDLIMKPEYVYDAVRYQIPRKLVGLLFSDDPEVCAKACAVLKRIAITMTQKMAIVNNIFILVSLAMALEDEFKSVRLEAATLLLSISKNPVAAIKLIEFGFIVILLKIVVTEDSAVAAVHLETIGELLCCKNTSETDKKAFDVLQSLLDNSDEKKVVGAIKCITTLVTRKCGKRSVIRRNLLPTFCKFLEDSRKEICHAAVTSIMHCTTNSIIKLKVAKMEGLPRRLIDIAKNSSNVNVQVHAMGALTNICEVKKVRDSVLANYMDDIKGLGPNKSEMFKQSKQKLINMINWVPS